MSKDIIERKIEQYRGKIDVLERELREINNKPHQSSKFHCAKCGMFFSYLDDEIVKIDGEPVCWACFDE